MKTCVPQFTPDQSAPFEQRGRAMIDAIHHDVLEYRLNHVSSKDLTGLLIRGLLPELPDNLQLHFHEVAAALIVGDETLQELFESGMLIGSLGLDGDTRFSVREVLDYLITVGLYGCPECSREDCICGGLPDGAHQVA